jgi:hypothetical protein
MSSAANKKRWLELTMGRMILAGVIIYVLMDAYCA